MIKRRAMLSAIAACSAWMSGAQSALARHHDPWRSYQVFLARTRATALKHGISPGILDAALALDRPNRRVIELDRHQPEFILTWADYRERVLTRAKLEGARRAFENSAGLLAAVQRRYSVDPRIIVGIWGLESDFGHRSGAFGVVDALASLAFDSRRPGFFEDELISALQILQRRDVDLQYLVGSYAGAMGQPQFMPSSYLRYAVDFDGDGRRDIWKSNADVLASIANYLARSGWIPGAPWGQPISVPAALDLEKTGWNTRRSLDSWMRLGVRRADGAPFSQGDVTGTILAPAGSGGPLFMIYSNFNVIRRYNPSDFYSLAVGLLAAATA